MSFYANEITGGKGHVQVMEHAGFKASLMKAQRLQGDHVHNLPPGTRIPIWPMSCLPGCPEEWVKEPGSYVCPVDSNWGLWFDFTMNDELNTAIVPSVKGMNPITGQKMNGMQLEQYSDKCPVHDEPFAHGRYCEKCEYEWPCQNYVSAPNTLWWDGFRQPNGVVRQFFFTDDDERDVASAVIGKKNTVPAFGFAFYKPLTPRTPPSRISYRGGYSKSSTTMNFFELPIIVTSMDVEHKTCGINIDEAGYLGTNRGVVQCFTSSTTTDSPLANVGVASCDDSFLTKSRTKSCLSKVKGDSIHQKAVAVGAGAQIAQYLIADPLGIKGWQNEFGGVIRLYFCFEKQFRNIVERGGIKELKSLREGFMKDVKVG